MRFDPVWRRIKPDAYTAKLEGQFRDRVDRLDGLNNWGSLAWLYEHATASKQAHHFGLEWNAIKFLESDPVRTKYRPTLRTAAHVLHWGHLPLGYAGEEALLRASHVDESTRKLLLTIIDDVVSFAGLRCDQQGHDCATAIRTAERPFELYRWLSAWLVREDWRRIWKAIRAASEDPLDQDQTKRELVETLVCHESRGFRVLRRCNEADYVPRDLLQAGTAWVTFDIEALWEGNPLGSDAAREWSLVDAAQSYLNDRFFHTPEALLVHSLVARAVAGGLLADGITKSTVTTLLAAKDEYFLSRLNVYHRDRLSRLRGDVPRVGEHWTLVGSFADVSLDEGARFEMEDQLSGFSGRSRVSYPFTSGVSVLVEPGASSFPSGLDFAGTGRQFATVLLHQQRSQKAARSSLNIVAKIAERTAPSPELGDNVMSWLLQGRVEQRSAAVDRVCSSIARDTANEFRAAVSRVLELKSAQEVLKHRLISGYLSALADPAFPAGERAGFAGIVLRLPWVCLRYGAGRSVLEILRDNGVQRTSSGKSADRGYALEAAVAADQLLEESNPKQRFLFVGATLLGKDGQPAQEWDVLRLDLNASQGWSLTAVECAVARARAKDDEARSKLEFLQTALAGRFSDLTTYRTLLATTKGGKLEYEDAGRSWSQV